MGRALIFAENLWSRIAFPGHTVTASENSGEAWKMANGRRASDDYWTPTTLNAAAYTTATYGRIRAVNMLALDRGHNLGGKTFAYQVSDDGFVTPETVATVTMPTVAGGSIDDPNGCATEEGAWLKRLTTGHPYAASAGRVVFNAMGTGLKPNVIGLQVGLGWEVDLYRPLERDGDQLLGEESETERGWVGAGVLTRARSGSLTVKLPDLLSYDQARYHLMGQYGAGRPTWLIFDTEDARDAVLIKRRARQRLAFGLRSDWGYQAATFDYQEHQAA